MVIIGDVHGCYKTLLALIAKLPDKNEQICFVGDLIDRGPSSREVVQYVIDNGHLCVLGNHEDMMINDDMFGNWMYNGGRATLKSYGMIDNMLYKSEDFNKHVEWMKKLPLDLLFANDNGLDLLVTHSSASRAMHLDSDFEFKKIVTWGRDKNPTPIPDVFNVFGHTPVNDVTIKPNNCAFIDTGAVYMGKLTALRFPQMEIYSQQLID